MKNFLHKHWLGLALLLFSILVGISVYQDYGISFDEFSQRDIGLTTYKYAIGQYPDFQNFLLKDHGPGFEWVLMFIEQQFDITDTRDIFLMRHLVTYIFFVLCMFGAYLFTYKLFKNRWLAALAFIALTFHPRLFAHAFFNPKDIPALCFYLLSIISTYWAFKNKKWYSFTALGLIIGYSTCVRLTNFVILAPIALLLLFDLIKAQPKQRIQIVTSGLLVLIGFAIMLYTTWPTLWEHPIQSFVEVYKSYSKFEWDSTLLYRGEVIHSTQIPWHYIPTWFYITTPELWLTIGTAGLFIFVARFIQKPISFFSEEKGRMILLSVFCLLLPVATIIILKSVVYDGWRHLYFIYVPFVILLIYAIDELRKTKLKHAITIVMVLQLLYTGYFLISSHPFQQVYFNHFVSHDNDYLKNNYELDYWGACNKQGLEWVANRTNGKPVKFNCEFIPSIDNYKFLTEHHKSQLIPSTEFEEMEYYIQFFRCVDFAYPNKDYPDVEILYEERLLGSPIYRIVKLR